MSRTMMLDELSALLTHVDRVDAGKVEYRRAIVDDNCLGKRSGQTRLLTYKHLTDLYALDPARLLFRALRFFWQRDGEGRPLLALLCTYARDPAFRVTAPLILTTPLDAVVSRNGLEELLEQTWPGRMSPATRTSMAQNINASWTKSGHLTGHVRKIRTRPSPTAGSVAYALLLGYLTGTRGQLLLQSEYVRLCDCPPDRVLELAGEASRRGWIALKQVGDVIDVLFPNLINLQEMEWLREPDETSGPVL